MRLTIATALLAAALGAAGCAAAPSTRVPEVVTARPAGASATAGVPATATGTSTATPDAASDERDADKPAGAGRVQDSEREVVAPHVDERDDEGAEDAAPEEGRE